MKIGKLIEIDYNKLKVKISSEIRGSSINLNGEVYYFGNIGSYLKVNNPINEIIICEVISISDSNPHQKNSSFDIESDREILLQPIGTIGTLDKTPKFTLGVGIFPSLYSDVAVVTTDDLNLILQSATKTTEPDNEKIHEEFSLGSSKNLINYPVNISINNFFNIHSAILGNSGSGKSNTVAHIIQEIYKKKAYSAIGSKILIFDVNDEYKQAFNKEKNKDISIKYLKPNLAKQSQECQPFVLPHFLMSTYEWSNFLLATEATQRPFLDKILQESYRFYKIENSDKIESQKFINYLRYKVYSLIHSILMQGETDTTKITTAQGILNGIANMINTREKLRDRSQKILKDIKELQECCIIEYGDNKNILKIKLEAINADIDKKEWIKVLNCRLQNGEYFDFKFLKIATELALLEEDAKGNKQIRTYTATMITRLEYFLENSECEFMRDDSEAIKSAKDFLSDLWGSDNSYQLVIIDVSELSPDILETLTSVLSRLLFDERKKLTGDNRRKQPVHLILDEAHRYIKSDYEYLLKENIFEKIAREGRKYSLYLLISSQRPSELSETVLSQCGNFIIHRIQNEKDMKYIQAILPYFSSDFANKIKQSIPGEALIFGNCVPMPLHLTIRKSDPEPNSANCNIPEEWFLPKT